MLPSSPEISFATAQDHAVCRTAIRQGSHSFFAASLLLPAAVRRPAYGLYAFCRLSDDAIDLEGGSPAALGRLRERIARAYDGRPAPLAADRAMADLVKRCAIPRALPEALLEGLAWDAQGRRYEELRDLEAYAARVAWSHKAFGRDFTLGAILDRTACRLNLRDEFSWTSMRTLG